MCVICYIPKEAKEPKKEDLLAMWNKNSHGAGIMWRTENQVNFSKGYMDFNNFYRDFLIIKRDYNFECAVHFRIATSGGINKQMCHPFPITNSETKIKIERGSSDVMIMHNGIISISPRKGLNDTCEYIIDELYPIYKKDKRFFLHLKESDESKIQNRIGYSKLLFFSKEGIKMIGDWKKFHDCYCSNLSFETPNYSTYQNANKKYNSNFKYGYLFDDEETYDSYYKFFNY